MGATAGSIRERDGHLDHAQERLDPRGWVGQVCIHLTDDVVAVFDDPAESGSQI